MAEDRFDQIHRILKRLYDEHDDIDACMVVRKGMEGVIMFPDDFIDKISTIWDPLNDIINKLMEIISDNVMYGIEKTYMEVFDYGIIFHTISMSDTSLVTFISKNTDNETIDTLSGKLKDIIEAKNRIQEIIE